MAVPALVAALPSLPEGKRAAVARDILRRWSPPARADWRAWSWGRARSWDAVDANRATLEYVNDTSGAHFRILCREARAA